MIQELKSKIGLEAIGAYVSSLAACVSFEDLQVRSKSMMEQVTSLVFPKQRIQFVPIDMPQDLKINIGGEENKQDISSEQQLINFIRKLLRAIEKKTNENSSDLAELILYKQTLEQTMKQFVKFNSGLQPALEETALKIDQINLKMQKVNKCENDLMEKVENLFKMQIQELEFGIQGMLKQRLTNAYKPITQVQDIEFPTQDALSYDNHLVSVLDNKVSGSWQRNFKLSNGVASKIKASIQLEEVKIEFAGKAVKKIIMWYRQSDAYFAGFQLLDLIGVTLFQTNPRFDTEKSQEIVLEDNERIIGFKARLTTSTSAHLYDFQFVLGSLI